MLSSIGMILFRLRKWRQRRQLKLSAWLIRREHPHYHQQEQQLPVPSTIIADRRHNHPGSERPHDRPNSSTFHPPVRLLTGIVLVDVPNSVSAVLDDHHNNSDEHGKVLDNIGEACPICLVEFVHGEEIQCPPACHHAYHTHCLTQWLDSTSSKQVCPCCRQPLMVKKHDDTRQNTPIRRWRQEPLVQQSLDFIDQPDSWMTTIISPDEEDAQSDAAVVTMKHLGFRYHLMEHY